MKAKTRMKTPYRAVWKIVNSVRQSSYMHLFPARCRDYKKNQRVMPDPHTLLFAYISKEAAEQQCSREHGEIILRCLGVGVQAGCHFATRVPDCVFTDEACARYHARSSFTEGVVWCEAIIPLE